VIPTTFVPALFSAQIFKTFHYGQIGSGGGIEILSVRCPLRKSAFAPVVRGMGNLDPRNATGSAEDCRSGEGRCSALAAETG
jgi:hypothetical protein